MIVFEGNPIPLQELLSSNNQLHQAILDSLTAHVAVLDHHGNIVAVNQAWQRFARENDGDLTQVGPGVNYLEVCRAAAASGPAANEAHQCLTGLQAVLNGSPDPFELEYPCHTPTEERWFLLRATRLNGENRGAIVLHLNITPQKQTEKALQESQARLSLLDSISAAAISELSVNQVSKQIVNRIGAYFPDLGVAYGTIDAADKLNILHATHPAGMANLAGTEAKLDVAPAYLAPLKRRVPVIVENVTEDSRLAPLVEKMLASGIQALLNISLVHADDLIGVLGFNAPQPRRWSRHEIITLKEAARHLALVIKKIQPAEAHRQTKKQLEEHIQKMETAYKQAVLYARALKQEITERRRAEKALSQSEERYRLLFSSGYDAIFVHKVTDGGLPGSFIEVNDIACQRLGYSREELLEMSSQDIDVGSQLEKTPQIMKTVLEKGHAIFETFHVPKMGAEIPVEISAHLFELNGQPAILSIARDVTQRKQAEAEIRRRNRELSLLNRIIAASAEDWEPKAFLETACRELALAFDVPQVAACLLNDLKNAASFVAEYRTEERLAMIGATVPIIDKPPLQQLFNNKELLVVNDAQNDPRLSQLRELIYRYDIAASIALPLIINGEAVGGLFLETNEQRIFSPEEVKLAWTVADQVAGALARAQLTQVHRRLTTAIEQAAETIFITTPEGTIVYVNPAFEQTTGYSQAEAVGQNPRILKSGQQEPAFYRELWATLTAGEIWQGRLVNRKKDGSRYTVEATISPVRDKEGHLVNYVAVQRDVTHELQLQDQYRQAQKMEAVGRLAGGIAHDFNNILTIISGHAELLLDQYPNSEEWVHQEVKEIQQASEQAITLTQQLLTFSRQHPIQLQVLNLNQAISNLEKMLKRLIGENIKLTTRLAPVLSPVKVDPGQFDQVIMNLTVNARDAMPYGGTLLIETANIEINQDDTEPLPEIAPGAYVLLSVTDTGFGMDVETQAHIFEPFFTTKGKTKGTGLGLATVYGIVQQSKGHISVSSAPGEGTTFKIYLPQVDEPVEPAKPAKSASTDLKTKRDSATILLVEDDPAVRLVTNKFLQKKGYTVLEALDSTEAVQICQNHPDPIHLLLTDVVMPRMSGYELADHLTKLRPEIKVLYISGYSDEELSHYEHARSDVGLLQKPFTSDSLMRKIRQILSQT